MTPTVIHSLQSISQLAAGALISSIWQGIVLCAGVALCLRFIPRTTATIRFVIWSAVFVILALLPVLHAYTPRPDQAFPNTTALLKLDIRWSFAIAASWALLSIIRAIKLAISALRLRTLWKRATPVEAAIQLPQAGFRTAQICTSPDVDRPSVIGFFSPRILIPAALFNDLTTPELEQIVLHEMGHLRRADDWINLLQKFGLMLFPLNPALMWIERRLCFERELACDDVVLNSTNAPKAYATCLTRLAETRLARSAASLSLGALEKQSQLSRRIHSILRRGEAMSQPQATTVLTVLVLGLIVGATALSRSPQLVSFTPSAPDLPTQSHAQPQAQSQQLPAATYQNVVFHPSAAPHATLLNATMPSNQPPATQNQPTRKHSRPAHKPALQHAKKTSPQTAQWVLLSSWQVSTRASDPAISQPRMILTVANESQVSSYAALPTPDGWLLIQL